MDITPLTSGLINSLLTHDILATAEEVADILWLFLYLTPEIEPIKSTPKEENIPSAPKEEIDSLPVSSPPPKPPPTLAEDTAEASAPRPPSPTPADSVNLYPPPSATTAGENNFSGHEEKLLLTGASALPHKLEIGRKLRILAKKIPSTSRFVVDELATVQLMADTGSLSMVYTPEKERWLNGILVVDNWPSMLMWEQTISELEQLFTQLGLFHTLRKYRLITDEKSFTTHLTTFGPAQKRVEPRELIDLTQRTIIFVISDCYSPAWSKGTKDKKSQEEGGMNWLLSIWGQKQQVVVFNVLPEIQWLQTALSTAHRVYVQSTKSNSPNAHLQIDDPLKDVLYMDEEALAWPVITLEPDYVEAWAKFFDGDTQIALPGYLLAEDDSYIFHKTAFPRFDTQLWQHFRATTSPTARELTGYLAAVPLTLPIMRLVQHTMIPHSHQGHLAEILNSHLVRLDSDLAKVTHPNQLLWNFIEGAREKLLTTVLMGDVEKVRQRLSEYVDKHKNMAFAFFSSAFFSEANDLPTSYINHESLAFAEIAITTFRHLGHENLAKNLQSAIDIFEIQQKKVPSNKNIDKTTRTYSLKNRNISQEKPTSPAPASDMQNTLLQWLNEGKITQEVYLALLNQPQASQEYRENQGSFNVNIGHDATFAGNITIINNPQQQEVLTPAVDNDSLLSKYLKHIISENRYLYLYGIRNDGNAPAVQLDHIYITLRTTQQRLAQADELEFFEGHRGAERGGRETISEAVTVNQALTTHQRLVVLGDPGSGKTIFLRYLALVYARDLAQNSSEVRQNLGLAEGGKLPILLSLRDIGYYFQRLAHENLRSIEGPRLLLDCLIAQLVNRKIPLTLAFLEWYLEKGEAIFLLDGLDEVADPDTRRQVARLVEGLTRTYPQCRYVVTSRIKGYNGSTRLQEGFVTSTVRDFSLEDIHQFLTRWHYVAAVNQHGPGEFATRQAQQKTVNLLQAIQANPHIQELAINPLLLTVIIMVYQDKIKLPDHRVDLYDEAVTVSVGQWDEAKGVKGAPLWNNHHFDTHDRRLLLQKLALHMQEHNLQGIRLQELEEWLQDYFWEFVVDDELPKVVERFLKLIKERTGLFIDREVGVYSFSHLIFQEYLAAVEIASQDNYLSYITQRCGDSWWREVILLVAGHFSAKHGLNRTTKLVETLANHKKEPYPHHNLILAAECLRDVDGRVSKEWQEEIPRRLRQALEAQPSWKDKLLGSKDWIRQRGDLVNALTRTGLGYWSLPYGEPEWIEIPTGEFWMGSDKGSDNEKPAHKLYLDTFWIARVPTTNAQYLLFVQATNYKTPHHWEAQRPPKGKENHPVIGVGWEDALAYCNWLSSVTNKHITLPSEAEWEKAARGMDNRLYPWGNEFDSLKCNSESLGINDTTPVGIFPAGASPYGVLDMAGNVSEWTRSIYGYWTKRQKGMKLLFLYPYIVDDGREDIDKPDNWVRTLRGGNYCSDMATCTVTYRRWDSPNVMASDFYGFRCVVHY